MKKNKLIRNTRADMVFLAVDWAALILFLAALAYPLAYVRTAPEEKLLVILNPSDRAVTLPWDRPLGPAVYALGGKTQKTENGLSVAPLSAGFYAID